MRLPLELAILFLVLAIWMAWDAMSREDSPSIRVAMVLSAIGSLMMAIAGRFPVSASETGWSPAVTVGAYVTVIGIISTIVLNLAVSVQRRRSKHSAGMPR
jgi:hypothetical protein